MATDGYAHRWNGVEYNASAERLMGSVLLMPGSASAFSARGGRRVNGAGLAVSVGGSPEQVSVTAGAGVIFDSGSASNGPWLFEIDSTKTLSLPARPSTGQSRIDLVVARVYDSDTGLGSAKELKVERVAGTPSATPSEPTSPASSLILARMLVPDTGSITVTPNPVRTVAAGGVLPVSTTAVRDSLSAYGGLVVWNEQTVRLERYDGTAWAALNAAAYVRRDRATSQGIPDQATTGVNITDATMPNDGLWTYSSTAPYEYTCQSAGFYMVVFSVQWDANTNGRRGLYVYVNGTQTPEGSDGLPGGTYAYRQQVIAAQYFNQGDTISARVYRSGGGSLPIVASKVAFVRTGV